MNSHKNRRTFTQATAAIGIAAVCAVALPSDATADPAPGFTFDSAELESRMNNCMDYSVGEQTVLIAWINVSTGDTRTWRCSSLRHMLLDTQNRPAHDPFLAVEDFIYCADKVVSYGFPRAGDPGNTDLIYQYNGTSNQAHVIVNDATGDIASIYTSAPASNDWGGCRYGR